MNEKQLLSYIVATQPSPDLSDILSKVDFANETYPNLEARVVSAGIATRPEFKKAFRSAERAHRIASVLGTVPSTPEAFIQAILSATCFTLDASAAHPLTWISPSQHRRVRMDMSELIEFSTATNRNLLTNTFRKSDVVDEVIHLDTNLKQAVRTEILKKITGPSAPFDWDGLVAVSFNTATIPAEITKAVLQKFIWQVKRRLAGEPVTYHLMPVIYGSQGCGKSVFITRMLAELGSLFATTDFNRLSDNREANLFRHFALFLDEMNKADRTDMDAVKAVITREELSYRPMGTNSSVTVDQNSTFIGASNKLLEQLLNDPTGLRRFFQIDFNSASGPKEFSYINALDMAAMWCSVDHLAVDPTEPYREQMKALQSRHVTRSSVGEFVDALIENEGRYRAPSPFAGERYERTLPVEVMRGEELFIAYRDWCAVMRKRTPLEQQGFFAEVRRMAAQEPGFPLQAKRSAKFNGWSYTGPVARATEVVASLNLRGERVWP